jgi:hypothetical protein
MGGLRYGVARAVTPTTVVALMDDTGEEEAFSRHDVSLRSGDSTL